MIISVTILTVILTRGMLTSGHQAEDILAAQRRLYALPLALPEAIVPEDVLYLGIMVLRREKYKNTENQKHGNRNAEIGK